MSFLVPEVVETERLILRQFCESDWADLHQCYSSVVATKYTFGKALTEAESWRMMSTMVGHWYLRDYGPYAVEVKSTATVIGTVGFWYPKDWPSPEIKWALAPDYWGQGYASEAARAVQKTAHQYMPELSLISFIRAENAASIALAKAIGAHFEKEVSFRNSSWHIYRHPAQSNSDTEN